MKARRLFAVIALVALVTLVTLPAVEAFAGHGQPQQPRVGAVTKAKPLVYKDFAVNPAEVYKIELLDSYVGDWEDSLFIIHPNTKIVKLRVTRFHNGVSDTLVEYGKESYRFVFWWGKAFGPPFEVIKIDKTKCPSRNLGCTPEDTVKLKVR